MYACPYIFSRRPKIDERGRNSGIDMICLPHLIFSKTSPVQKELHGIGLETRQNIPHHYCECYSDENGLELLNFCPSKFRADPQAIEFYKDPTNVKSSTTCCF